MQLLPYTTRGIVINGFKQSRRIGLPTANMKAGADMRLAEGSYVGWSSIEGSGQRLPSLIFFGTPHAMKEASEPRVEVYLLDQTLELYGKELEVTLEKFLRPNEKFDDEKTLVEAIHGDHEKAKKYFEFTKTYNLSPITSPHV